MLPKTFWDLLQGGVLFNFSNVECTFFLSFLCIFLLISWSIGVCGYEKYSMGKKLIGRRSVHLDPISFLSMLYNARKKPWSRNQKKNTRDWRETLHRDIRKNPPSGGLGGTSIFLILPGFCSSFYQKKSCFPASGLGDGQTNAQRCWEWYTTNMTNRTFLTYHFYTKKRGKIITFLF